MLTSASFAVGRVMVSMIALSALVLTVTVAPTASATVIPHKRVFPIRPSNLEASTTASAATESSHLRGLRGTHGGDGAATATAPSGANGTASDGRVGAAATAQIVYHGGPVMGTSAGVRVFCIYYGAWTDTAAKTILTDFLNNLGGSPWYNIMTTYTDNTGARVSSSVTLAGTTTMPVGYISGVGTNLADGDVFTIVSKVLAEGRFGAADTNAVYFVLTSPEVTQTSSATDAFCTSYCGWHTYDAATNLKYVPACRELRVSERPGPSQTCSGACCGLAVARVQVGVALCALSWKLKFGWRVGADGRVVVQGPHI